MIVDVRCPKCNRPLAGSEDVVIRKDASALMRTIESKPCKCGARVCSEKSDDDIPGIHFAEVEAAPTKAVPTATEPENLDGMTVYELRAAAGDGEPYTVWSGINKPTPMQIKDAIRRCEERGWNGTEVELFRNDEWIQTLDSEWWDK